MRGIVRQHFQKRRVIAVRLSSWSWTVHQAAPETRFRTPGGRPAFSAISASRRAASGITEQQWRVLRVLSDNGAMDASKLAEQASLLLPSLTRIAQNMVPSGLITRATDTRDRRRLVLTITTAGQAIIDDNRTEAARIAQRFEDVLGRERLDELLDALARLDDL